MSDKQKPSERWKNEESAVVWSNESIAKRLDAILSVLDEQHERNGASVEASKHCGCFHQNNSEGAAVCSCDCHNTNEQSDRCSVEPRKVCAHIGEGYCTKCGHIYPNSKHDIINEQRDEACIHKTIEEAEICGKCSKGAEFTLDPNKQSDEVEQYYDVSLSCQNKSKDCKYPEKCTCKSCKSSFGIEGPTWTLEPAIKKMTATTKAIVDLYANQYGYTKHSKTERCDVKKLDWEKLSLFLFRECHVEDIETSGHMAKAICSHFTAPNVKRLSVNDLRLFYANWTGKHKNCDDSKDFAKQLHQRIYEHKEVYYERVKRTMVRQDIKGVQMNGVKIKDISGLLIEKKQEPDAYCASALEIRGIREHNKTIDQQGEKRIGLNRDRLALSIATEELERRYTHYSSVPIEEHHYAIADKIIANQADILEVVE